MQFAFLPVVIPDSQVKPGISGSKHVDIKNLIPEAGVTALPTFRKQPFDYEGEVYVGTPNEGRPGQFPEEEEVEEENNQLNPRGDVFSECPFDAP